jgi:hypothetical protein
MVSVLKEGKGRKEAADLVLELYLTLLIEIWEIVSALIGETILTLLFLSAIRKIGEKHPFLTSLKVSEEGIASDRLKEVCRKLSPLEIHRGFQNLINHLFQLFSTMADGVINKELFPKAFPKFKEADRIISKK